MSYTTLATTVSQLIVRKGVACTWESAVVSVDGDDPWKETVTAHVQHSTNIVLLPFDSVSRRMLGYSEDRSVPAGSLVGYVPGSTTFVPALRDTIIVGSKTYTVAALDIINPDANVDILYVVELLQ